MPNAKFQIVFGHDEQAEMHMLIDGELRKTALDLSDAPFSTLALQAQPVQEALKAWMTAAQAPAWMSWVDIETALTTADIGVDQLAEQYPPM